MLQEERRQHTFIVKRLLATAPGGRCSMRASPNASSAIEDILNPDRTVRIAIKLTQAVRTIDVIPESDSLLPDLGHFSKRKHHFTLARRHDPPACAIA